MGGRIQHGAAAKETPCFDFGSSRRESRKFARDQRELSFGFKTSVSRIESGDHPRRLVPASAFAGAAPGM